MTVRHPCPACGKRMYLDVVHEGHRVPCPHCGHRFEVPAGAVAAQDELGATGSAVEDEVIEPEFVDLALEPDHLSDEDEAPGPWDAAQRREHVATVLDVDGMPPVRRHTVARERPHVPRTRVADVPGDSDNGLAALLCGIGGFLICGFLFPVAWHLGAQSRRRAGELGYKVPGMAQAGYYLGLIGTLLMLIPLVLVAVAGIAAVVGSAL